MSKLYAIGQKVIVKEIKEEKSSGLIILNQKEENQVKANIVHAGEECKEVFEGQIVIFSRYHSASIELDEENFMILDESNILAVLIG